MNELVFTAQEVVDAATGVVCIKVDGDERKDLVEKHKVTGYPTGVLLNESNEEIARFLGYASVKQTKELFSKVKK